MNMSKRIQAFWLAVIMAFLLCCTAFAEAMPGVATGNDLGANSPGMGHQRGNEVHRSAWLGRSHESGPALRQ